MHLALLTTLVMIAFAANSILNRMALGGLVWLNWPGGTSVPSLSGVLLMLAAAIGWGFHSLLGRGAKDPLGNTGGVFFSPCQPGWRSGRCCLMR